ncbi:hypothetical protein GF407_11125 [candidate division KSB1 bacterium]|nr:hypothetical protein [candidate division KSB1 bacterium]
MGMAFPFLDILHNLPLIRKKKFRKMNLQHSSGANISLDKVNAVSGELAYGEEWYDELVSSSARISAVQGKVRFNSSNISNIGAGYFQDHPVNAYPKPPSSPRTLRSDIFNDLFILDIIINISFQAVF